ncbi:hypothetical protein NQ314_005555 [Rhamnusium bicolor]|uniref:Peptidase S1 domain-containing protein n=1 Tax=Rhamnusium bicolor TaxID=1586634 RepID=A0AAV8ZH29_9CUCU|nr:hypothetical protein NQ314_005555 [Rhamnusium bicolor]
MLNSSQNTRKFPNQIESIFILLITLIINNAYCQLVSPCPKLFKYEPNNNENDRWYGQVTLLSDSELSGVWLRLIFDKPSSQLGNWFGEVVTQDNKEYLVKNRNHKLLANVPYSLRFYLKYNPNESPPQLVAFRLNAKTVCPEGGITTEAPTTTGQLLTSSELSTTSMPNTNVANTGQSGTTFVRPGGGGPSINNQNSDDDDFFHGDFSLLQKPHQNVLNSACGTVIRESFPWHAALYHARGIDLTYICGASLISRYHLITVAHCVTRRKSQTTLSPGSLVVYLGRFYLKTWSNPGIQDKHVGKIIVHPKYSAQTFSNDLAILKLTTPADITDYVRPICLWEEQISLEMVVGKQGIVVGWGFDENGKVTEELTKAHMPVVSQETCIYSFPDFYSRFTSEHTFCAGFKNEKFDLCGIESFVILVHVLSVIFNFAPINLEKVVEHDNSSPMLTEDDDFEHLEWIEKSEYFENLSAVFDYSSIIHSSVRITKEISYFQEIFDDYLFSNIVEQTNLYAIQKSIKNWIPLSVPELKAHVPDEVRLSYVGSHFPARGSYRRCRMCSTKANEERTPFTCTECKVPVCVPN